MGRSRAIVPHKERGVDLAGRSGSIRIRRAVLTARRAPTTPVPSWKLYENPSYDGIVAGLRNGAGNGKQIAISARKLAATLWELQELPLVPNAPTRSPKQQLMLPPPSPATPVPQNSAKLASSKSSARSPFTDSNNDAQHSRRTSDDTYTSEMSRQSFEVGSRETKLDSGDLIKVLNHIKSSDKQSLRAELERARQRMRELERAEKHARREVAELMEDQLRLKKEVEEERRARRLMEEVCEELAKEIGRDKAEVEEHKREAAAARREVDEERRMLQMAEVWREERVQMKMAEARHELEDRVAALDRLRAELDDFLSNRRRHHHQAAAVYRHDDEGDVRRAMLLQGALDSLKQVSSGEDDLHSIDLNKESLYDRTQSGRWHTTKHDEQEELQEDEECEEGGEHQLRNPAPKPVKKVKKASSRGKARGRLHRRRSRPVESAADSCSSDEERNNNGISRVVAEAPFSGEIETIPENCELYVDSNNSRNGSWQIGSLQPTDDFGLAFAQIRDRNLEQLEMATTRALGVVRHSAGADAAAAAAVGEAVATPQRKSWSPGELNPYLTKALRGWQSASHELNSLNDNSLRAKLLLEESMDKPLARRVR